MQTAMVLWRTTSQVICKWDSEKSLQSSLTLLHSEGPKLYRVLAILSAIGLNLYPNIFYSLNNL